MSLSDQIIVQRIASFTGLDNETVSTQILPYIKKLPDAQALRHHMIDLLGPGSAQSSFIKQLAESQSRSTASTAPTPPAPSALSAPGHPESSHKLGAAVPVDISNASGAGGGAVYSKDRGGDQKHTYRDNGRHLGSASSRPLTPHGTRTPTLATGFQASTSTSDHIRPSDAQIFASSQHTFQLSPTDEMRMLDGEIAELTGAGVGGIQAQKTKLRKRTCYCQGRVHALFKRSPICLSCGLLQCSLNTPTPFSPEASCPSCGIILLASADRSRLLSSLVSQREDAERRALLRVEQIRVEREKAKEEKRAVESKELFPELAGGDATARERARQLSIAMGRKPREDGEGVTRMGMGERRNRVLTIGKKGKVTVGSTSKKPTAKGTKSASISFSKGQQTIERSKRSDGEAENAVDEQSDVDVDEDEEEDETEELLRLGFILDEDEDALGTAIVESEEPPALPSESTSMRAYFNPYLSWTGQEEGSEKVRYISLCERKDLDGKEVAEDVVVQGGAEQASGTVKGLSQEGAALKGRPAIPGAAADSLSGAKSRRRDKKKAKGDEAGS